jgi:hypothetical protein
MPLLFGNTAASGAGYRGQSSALFATSASQITADFPSAPSGLYYMNIGDGRGVTQYYVNTSFSDGPWVLVENNMNLPTGDAATDGLFNNGSPSITPASAGILNTNFAGNGISEIPYTGLLGTNGVGDYVWFLFDATARAIINAEYRDTAGEVSTNSAALSYFNASKVGYKLAAGSPTVRYSSTVQCTVEVHHSGWNAGASTNSIIQTAPGGGRSGGSGADFPEYGWQNHGFAIVAAVGAYLNGGNPSIFIKI